MLPFDDVLAECLETAKKYYSCYPLLFQLGTLLINHAAQASNSEQVTQIMEKGPGMVSPRQDRGGRTESPKKKRC